jgi:multidrug resistance efflux pump
MEAHTEKSVKHGDAGRSVMRKFALPILIVFAVAGIAGGVWYYSEQQKYIFTDKAEVSVPMVSLTPKTSGVLKEVLVSAGDHVFARQTIARVGDEMISSEEPGIIATAKQDIGAIYNASQAVATMYDPDEMRIVARIEEDKGLKDIKPLQKVKFTVDAFGSREFEGYVEEISQTSRSGDVVFNISDKREEQEFEVKIRYDRKAYPDFKNGMSARVWIIK